jgi:ABC-2 type transport system ATP-binding protein
MAADVLLKTVNLTKRYRGAPIYALEDLSIQVPAGQVYGYLGSNGAGKSTTIRTLLGFLKPSDGSASICGLDIVNDSLAVKLHVGYLAGDVALYPKMTGGDLLRYLQALQPLKHIDYFSGLVKDFEAELDKPIRELSKGNRQKIGLLQAFMHEPEVLILDEPTSGLDPLMQEVFYDYVRGCRQRGGAVFLSSHNLGEVQHMCDRVGIIRAGKLIKELAVDDLGKVSTQRFTLTFDGAAPKALASVPEVTLLNINGPQAIVQVSKDLQPLLSYLSTKKLRRLASDQTTLEDEFMQFYEELGK